MEAENSEEEKGDGQVDGGLVNEDGVITISEDVLTAVVASGASQIEGLGEKKSSVAEDIVRIFGSRRRGVEIDLDGDSVSITLKIAVKKGYPVHEVAQKTQEKIKEEVENKTGIQVRKVNIYVQKLQLTGEEHPVLESEAEEEGPEE